MGSLGQEFLRGRLARFYDRYSEEVESIAQLLTIRLKQLALAYTLEHDLPREAVSVTSRVKSQRSFIKKLEKKGWPDFYLPTEVITDLIGARVICWFLDDCYGMLEYTRSSQQFTIRPESVEDFISKPKRSGYRSIHLLLDIAYDRVKLKNTQMREITQDSMVCEVQIRSKLQDAWAEFTHEVHYKDEGGFEDDYERLVSTIADRLSAEDKQACAVRNILQKISESKEHEGFKPADSKETKKAHSEGSA